MDEPAAPAIDPSRIQPEAAKVVNRLSGQGFRAYLVGGCVRDLLLDRPPKDFDVATSARPRQVKRLFRNSRIIGRRFRLAHVHFGHRVIEVATFRAAPQPEDDDDLYIRRDNVWGSEKEDAFRRDFTINGLFYDLQRGRVIDHVGGLDDLAARKLRVIGDPDVRLREDPVRILRAARFAARLGFTLSEDLAAGVRTHAEDLRKAAPPRVLEELYRLCASPGAAEAFRLLEELGALPVLIPEICPLPEWFFNAMRGVEAEAHGDRSAVPQWLMVALLAAPHALPRMAEADASVQDYDAVATHVLRPLLTRLTVARRDAAHAQQCLAAQMRLLEPPRGRSARRYVRRDFFHDALHLRRLVGPARPVDPDPLPQWEAWAHDARPAPGGEPGPARGETSTGGRRRRRGRRGGLRRRRRRGRSGSCPPDSASSSAHAPPPPPKRSPPDSSNGGSSPA